MPLILGWPFLATVGAIINVRDGKLVLMVKDEEVTFKIFDAMNHCLEQNDTFYFLDVVDIIVFGSMQEILQDDLLESYLIKGKEKRLKPFIEDPLWVLIRSSGLRC